ncbi:ATP synthase subunit b, mitochondrial [Frankliniella fusca]|uniref:ATP synthase subunit b n=2 Tax=Arthropoda TaxID=6656 RepID=A0AAE1HED3_9NEOP|nr:ATP synthase subunit b, mitochondrial [Frankliniella fusca]
MLSRLATRAAQPIISRSVVLGVRQASSEPAKTPASDVDPYEGLEDPAAKLPRIIAMKAEGPERDLVNFPRPVVKMHPDPVRLGFIPEEWFDIFYKKTGVSGPYVFGASFITYLLSKEIYVLEHNFYNGISFVMMMMILHYKFGPKIAQYADKEIDKWLADIREYQDYEKKAIKENIQEIHEYLSTMDSVKDLTNARRETAAAALEATYREWTQTAYSEAKKRLDYQLELTNVERRISQKNMSSWITENVLKSITPTQEAETMKRCISDLKSLSVSV